MKLMSIVALAVALSFTASQANAAWQSEVRGNDEYYVAWVHDSTDTLQIDVDCSVMLMEHSISLVSIDAWDDAASYPDSVPVTLAVDGEQFAAIPFRYENSGGNVAISAYETDAPQIFQIINAMSVTETTIEVSFLGQTAYFTPEAVSGALSDVIWACFF